MPFGKEVVKVVKREVAFGQFEEKHLGTGVEGILLQKTMCTNNMKRCIQVMGQVILSK